MRSQPHKKTRKRNKRCKYQERKDKVVFDADDRIYAETARRSTNYKT